MESYDIIVLGAGISGLAAAWYLKKEGIQTLVLEKDKEVGGKIKSYQANGFVIERGPNSLLLREDVLNLLDDLKLTDQLVPANDVSKNRQILWDNKLHAISPSPLSILKTPLLSLGGKLRLFRELGVRSSSPKGETTYEFFTRRFGKQLATRIAGAMISGIYAGDIRELEMEAIFPQIVVMEKEHGSIIRGMMKGNSSGRKIAGMQTGIQQLPIALAEKLGDAVRMESEIMDVQRKGDKWQISYLQDGKRYEVICKNLISTLPSFALAPLLNEAFPEISAAINQVPYNPMLLLHVEVDQAEMLNKAQGFGFLASIFERNDYIGTMYNSTVFDHVSEDNKGLCTFFVKPPEEGEINASDIFEQICEPLFRQWAFFKGKLELMDQSYWPNAIPQKIVGHTHIVDKIQQFEQDNPGIYLSGNYRSGVSVSDCITFNKELAYRLTSERS